METEINEIKNSIVTTLRLLLEKFKYYPTQAGIMITLLSVATNAVVGFAIYLYYKGYCYYFYIEDNFMTISDKLTIYRFIIIFIIFIAYWIYSIFAMETWRERNKKSIAFAWIIAPFIIISIISFLRLGNDLNIISYFMFCGFFLFFNILMAIITGGLYTNLIFRVTSDGREKKTNIHRTFILTIVFLIIAGISLFCSGKEDAKSKRSYDIITENNNDSYVIIQNNGRQILIQKCDIDLNDMKLVIDSSSYKMMNCTDILIHRYSFKEVDVKK